MFRLRLQVSHCNSASWIEWKDRQPRKPSRRTKWKLELKISKKEVTQRKGSRAEQGFKTDLQHYLVWTRAKRHWKAKKKKKRWKTPQKTRAKGLWGIMKRANVCIPGAPEGDEKQHTGKVAEEIMATHLPNLAKHRNLQIQEPWQASSK